MNDGKDKKNNEMLSMVSHQMRAPLAAMKGYVTLITDGAYGEINHDVREALGKVQFAADGLLDLLDTILDARRVDDGLMEHHFIKTDLVPFITDIVDSIMPLAKAKGLALTVDCKPEAVLVSADASKLRFVIHNVIDNAIKYTSAGFVKVTLKITKGNASIAVSDSGYGMSSAIIPHVFEEFIRAERAKKEVRGAGLGLYIAKNIADAHGATLIAESPGEERGSTFTFTIPLM